MSINVYISETCGNTAIRKNQNAITNYLDAHKIEYKKVDLATCKNAKEEMRAKIPPERKEGKQSIIAPQIFKGDEYLGDYDDFFCAQEDECLEQFFKLPPKEKESVGLKKVDVRSEEASADDKEKDKNAENVLNNKTQDIQKKSPSPTGVQSGNGGESVQVEKGENKVMRRGEKSEVEQKVEQKGEIVEAEQEGKNGEVEHGPEREGNEVKERQKEGNSDVEQGNEEESADGEQSGLNVVTEDA